MKTDNEAQNRPWLSSSKGCVIIRIHVQPRAASNCICGIHNNRLKIRVQAPPTDGSANKSCQKILAKKFNVSKSSVSLEAGASSKYKVFKIKNITFENALKKLND